VGYDEAKKLDDARASYTKIRQFPNQQQPEIFRPISPAAWQGRTPPRRDWLVENAFLRGTVALVSGDGGIGKSLLMQQLCSCSVLGKPFLGMACEPGPALYIACEDDHDELWRRQWCINRSLARDMDDFAEGGLVLSPRVGMDNSLVRLDRRSWTIAPTALMLAVSDWCVRMGVVYVVFDTATQMLDVNQNDERQVMQAISILRQLAMRLQGLVIITKHPSMAGRALGTGESGNVAWNNSVRSRWYLNRHQAHGLVFETKKSNYGPSEQRISLEYRGGVFVRVDPITREAYQGDSYHPNGYGTAPR
jgi:RecA-family ATPase